MTFQIHHNGRYKYTFVVIVVVSLESRVGIAKAGTKSLRATVPEGIVAFLNIQVGDKLEWKMDILNNERIAIVRKRSGNR